MTNGWKCLLSSTLTLSGKRSGGVVQEGVRSVAACSPVTSVWLGNSAIGQ